MLIKPIQMNIDSQVNSVDEEYDGIVVDNLDPLMLGRVKVSYSIIEDAEDKDLPWCYPTGNVFLGNSKESIAFSVPEIGSDVKVYFPTKDMYMPYYKGTEFNSENMCTFFADEDYPQVYGFKDSIGNFVRVNKKRKTITIQHSSTSNLFIDSDGSITYTLPDGSYFEMLNGGTWTISSGAGQTSVFKGTPDGIVTLDCQAFIVKSNKVTFDSPDVDCTGSLKVANADSGTLQLLNGLGTVNAGIITSLKIR